MRLLYNPKHVLDTVQIWKCFLLGSMTVSSLIIFVVTENVIVFIAMLALIIAGVALFLKTNMNFTKPIYLFQNLVLFGIGAVISLVINVTGFLPVYFVIILILVLVTWLHKYTVKIKIKKRQKEEAKEEAKPQA